MKTLIIYTEFGNGHKTAALNISKKIEGEVFLHNIHYEVAPKRTKIIEKVYNDFFTKYSNNKVIDTCYNHIYNFINNNELILNKFVKNVGEEEIEDLIQKYNVDLIITTFPHKIETNIPVIVMVTDYSFDKCWLLKKEDYYFIADSKIQKNLLKNGVNKKKIYEVGILIEPTHFVVPKRKQVKKILFNLGARGHTNKKYLFDNITNISNQNLEILVVCGKNKKLYSELKGKFGRNIKIYGYVDNIHELIASSDLVITKAGGLSIAECIHYNTPLIIDKTQSLSGQEQGNYDFVIKHNIGKVLKAPQISEGINFLSENVYEYSNYCKNIQSLNKKYQEYDIMDIIREIKEGI